MNQTPRGAGPLAASRTVSPLTLLLFSLGGLLADCGGTDPCDGIAQSCLSVRVEADGGQQTDLLRVFVSTDGGPAVERQSTRPSGQAASFPLLFTVLLGDRGGAVNLDVVAQLAGAPVLRGNGSTSVAAGEHAKLTVTLGSAIGDLPVDKPAARSAAAFAYSPERRTVILFGGLDGQGQPLADTWEYAPGTATWTRLAGPTRPSARAASLAYHPRRQALVLFGGLAAGGKALADMWILDANGLWSELPLLGAPSARSGAALVYDDFRDGLELYGGKDPATGQPLSDLWELPAASSTFSARVPTLPAPVVAAPHLVFDGRNTLLVGSDEVTLSAIKIWRIDPLVFTELTPGSSTPPSRRSELAAAFDRQDGSLVLFGGTAAGAPVGDTYYWSPTDSRWTLGTAAGPSARRGALVDFVPQLGGLLLLGGQGSDGVPLADRWTLSARAWQQLP